METPTPEQKIEFAKCFCEGLLNTMLKAINENRDVVISDEPAGFQFEPQEFIRLLKPVGQKFTIVIK